MLILTTNLAFLATELNAFIHIGSEYVFSPEVVKGLKKLTNLSSNDGLEIASNVVSHVGFQKTYNFYGTFYTSKNVETLLYQNLGCKYDVISRDFLRDRLGIQLKFCTANKNLSSFYAMQAEMLISKNEYLSHYHISVSSINENAALMVESLENGGWSYDLISPEITNLDLKNLQIDTDTRDILFESIYDEFR